MRIRLFGSLEIAPSDDRPAHFATRKASLVLAALVLARGHALSREQLAEAFWPGRGPSQARNSLRQALVDIRRVFPTRGNKEVRVEGDQETISLTGKADGADVWCFDHLIASGRPADLAAAAELYRGELLGTEVIPHYIEEWFGSHRSQYQRKVLELVEKLSLAPPPSGPAEEAVCEGLAERLLASDPTAEAAHRALIRIHARRGQENLALRQFEMCRAALKKQLDVEPEAVTLSLARTLRSRGGSLGHASSAPVPTPFPDPALGKRDRPSLAVLPFQNLNETADQDWFADGIVEEVITKLASFPDLVVVSKGSSFAYKGRPFDVRHVGRELDVRYIVEGSVRRAGEQLRITAQLIDASADAHLWADRFHGSLADVFDLQERIASSIVGAIRPKVEGAEIERARRKPTDSLDAYDYYLRGLALSDGSAVSLASTEEALRNFMEAVRRDPDFAVAHARAARCYAVRKSNRWMVDQTAEAAEAMRLARRAVEVGRDDASALAFGGFVLGYIGGDLEESDACIDRGLTLNPSSATALGFSSWVSACIGQQEKAVEQAERAIRLSPLDPRLSSWQFCAALGHFCGGRYEKAASAARAALRLKPAYASAIRVAAASYALAGKQAEASEMLARLRELDPSLRLADVSNVLPPFRRTEDRDRIIRALRSAGLE